MRKPRKTIKRGLMKVMFFSDRKNNAPGATCFVKCSSKGQTIPPTEPTAAPEDVLLLVGGYNGSSTLKSSEVYGGSLSCPVQDLPSPTTYVNAVYFDNKVLACGGKSAEYEPVDKCYLLEAPEWSEHSNLNFGRLFSSTVVAGGSLYMLGGEDQVSNYEVLAAGSTEWVVGQPNIPGQVDNSCAVAVYDGFVIIGSYYDDYNTQVLQYDGSDWNKWANLAEGRWDHSCILFNGNIIVAGGRNSGNTALATTVIIDTEMKTSSDGPNLSGTRTGFVFANVNGLALAVGGSYDGDGTPTGEKFDPTEDGGGTLHQNLTTTRDWMREGAVVPKSVIAKIIGCS